MQSNKKEKIKDLTCTEEFSGIIVKDHNGFNKLELDSKEYYQHQLNLFDEGEHVTLFLNNKKTRRTAQQNKYYWGVYLPLIASDTGERDLDHLHELFKGKFLTKAIVEVMGELVRIKKSTTKLSTKDFSDYIKAIEELTGVIAPPTENLIYKEDH